MAKKKVNKEMIWISGNVPSSKNSRITSRATGRSFPSKNTQKYIKESKPDFLLNKTKFLNMLAGKQMPYLVEFHFVRQSRHRWDFHNMVQVLCDLFQEHEYLEDDCTDVMFPIPLEMNDKLYSYDKENPGVWISVK
jgi:hypothetical protein